MATNNLPNNMVLIDEDVPIFEASSGLLDEGALADHITAIEEINNGNNITKQAIDHTDANEDEKDTKEYLMKVLLLIIQ